MDSSETILARIQASSLSPINLTLRPAYFELLQGLGNPQQKLKNVIHVAGTNGKGSTCAFLRAILEAAGHTTNVYTSPHLVHFHERIRLHGKLIEEEDLAKILDECEGFTLAGEITYFEFTTAAAFTAFARKPADYTIVEVGMGGRMDATNLFDHPLVTAITRISKDHREYLGETLSAIAKEKAGIMETNVPCVLTHQPDTSSEGVLIRSASYLNCPTFIGDRDWKVTINADGSWTYASQKYTFELPAPGLLGVHQYENASLAIAALEHAPLQLTQDSVAKGLQTVAWPARLQRLTKGPCVDLLPEGWELWLDGGHNDSAGEVLAEQAKTWRQLNDNKPLALIVGMMASRQPREFLQALTPFIASMRTVTIPGELRTHTGDQLATLVLEAGIRNVSSAQNVQAALKELIHNRTSPCRVLICGSLYLAGAVLKEHQ